MEKLIAVYRRSDGLFGLLSKRRNEFVPPDSNSQTMETDADPFFETLLPIQELPSEQLPDRNELLNSWEKISEVETLDQDALTNVIHICFGTVIDPEIGSSVLPKKDRPTPRKILKSPAHPRGFIGTKYKPPKASRISSRDLRPLICSPREQGELFKELAHLFPANYSLLQGTGIPEKTLKKLLQVERIQSDPYHWQWHSLSLGKINSLPIPFQKYLLWPVRWRWDNFTSLLSYYWSLGLSENKPLRRAISHLLAVENTPSILPWLQLLVAQCPERRLRLVELFIHSEVLENELNEKDLSLFQEISSCSDDGIFYHRFYRALLAQKEIYDCQWHDDDYVSANISALTKAFDLADQYQPDTNFDKFWAYQYSLEKTMTTEPVINFMAYIDDCSEIYSWEKSHFAVDLWERCLFFPGFHELLGRLPWNMLPPEPGFRFCRNLVNLLRIEESYDELQQRWTLVSSQAHLMFQLVVDTGPSFREKVVLNYAEVLWELSLEELKKAIPRLLDLLTRITKLPFEAKGQSNLVYEVPLRLKDDNWRAFFNAEDKSFLSLERRCQRKNDAMLIAKGLHTLQSQDSPTLVNAFKYAPNALFKTMKILGALSTEERTRCLQKVQDHPLWNYQSTTLRIDQLVILVDSIELSSGKNPVRKKLRDYLSGKVALTDRQISGHFARLENAIPQLKMELLETTVIERLTGSFDREYPNKRERHALLMQEPASEHRRALRKVIHQYFQGNRDYLSRHPINQNWLAMHPKIDSKIWLDGLKKVDQVSGIGAVHLTLESDPLEVLQLGTHMGTCLGLGGSQAHSAAAIMLDINKQVIFARVSDSIIARQVLTISEDDTLICFEVYPKNSSAAIKALFRDYDQEFAREMGIPIEEYETASEDKIELLIASNWWYDYAWDFDIEAETMSSSKIP